jgi:hypothetical protein
MLAVSDRIGHELGMRHVNVRFGRQPTELACEPAESGGGVHVLVTWGLGHGHELGTASRLINSAQPGFAAREIVADKARRYVALR